MIDSGQKQKISQNLSGKVPVIIITVFFSCLSLTLGYFVGKMGPVNRTDTVIQPQETLPAQQSPQAGNSQVLPLAEPLKTNVSATDQLQKAESPEQQGTGGAPGEVKSVEPAKESAVKPVRESSSEAVQNMNAEPAVKKSSEEGLYAVQLGAFRNRAEADRFRAKYSKKGYKIYIMALKTGRNLKVYKVKTGEFREKKDADILSLKLKKTEGLNTFVTPAYE